MPKMKKVLLVIEASGSYGRGLLRGVANYSRLHGPWSFFRDFPEPNFYLEPGFYSETGNSISPKKKNKRAKRFEKLDIDGIITRDPRAITGKSAPSIAAVHLKLGLNDVPSIIPNNKMIGKMAAEHFLDRGFREFAFCGFENVYWSDQRFLCFSKFLRERGYEVSRYVPESNKRFRFREDELPSLANWLNTLAANTGLLVCNDNRAQQVMDACRVGDIRVPQDIAVLSIDNDELVCDLADPPISSIELNAEQAGYEAAETLDRMMNGERFENYRIEVKPVRVVTRRSSDILSISDPDVLDALYYIRNNSKRAVSVDDVVEEVAVSRRVLERKFRNILSRSILDEIRLARAREIQVLLTTTNMSIMQIAAELDFSTSKQICRLFKKEYKISPMSYRKRYLE
jgi:LacI family transcriptional regulator